MTGATGAVYGTRILQELRRVGDVETHVVISRAGLLSAAAELDVGRRDLEALGDVAHAEKDIGASIASGSFKTDGMIIAPCSMRTLAAIATGVTDNLVARAADVVLKERRRLVLLARETPLTLVHLRNMVTVTEMGGVVFPPVPAFYAKLDSLDAMIDQTVGRVLDLFDIDSPLVRRWSGVSARRRLRSSLRPAGRGQVLVENRRRSVGGHVLPPPTCRAAAEPGGAGRIAAAPHDAQLGRLVRRHRHVEAADRRVRLVAERDDQHAVGDVERRHVLAARVGRGGRHAGSPDGPPALRRDP